MENFFLTPQSKKAINFPKIFTNYKYVNRSEAIDGLSKADNSSPEMNETCGAIVFASNFIDLEGYRYFDNHTVQSGFTGKILNKLRPTGESVYETYDHDHLGQVHDDILQNNGTELRQSSNALNEPITIDNFATLFHTTIYQRTARTKFSIDQIGQMVARNMAMTSIREDSVSEGPINQSALSDRYNQIDILLDKVGSFNAFFDALAINRDQFTSYETTVDEDELRTILFESKEEMVASIHPSSRQAYSSLPNIGLDSLAVDYVYPVEVDYMGFGQVVDSDLNDLSSRVDLENKAIIGPHHNYLNTYFIPKNKRENDLSTNRYPKEAISIKMRFRVKYNNGFVREEVHPVAVSISKSLM